jgi:hypothetical protein
MRIRRRWGAHITLPGPPRKTTYAHFEADLHATPGKAAIDGLDDAGDAHEAGGTVTILAQSRYQAHPPAPGRRAYAATASPRR